jgi:YfiH family protein
MIRSEAGGVPYYVFEALADQGHLVHAVFTRLGGVSPPPYWALNVGHSVGDDPHAVEANHDLIYKTLRLSSADVVTAHQVHSNHVAVVDEQDAGRVIPETDALVTAVPGVYLLLRFADCLPVFLYDPEEQVVAIGHAGWRGTAAMVASQMIQSMKVSFGSEPAHLVASLGPAIGPCCYRVGEEVVEAIRPTLEDWRAAIQRGEDSDWSLDLWEANRQHLMGQGVRQVETGRICTACHAAEFFSHRADGGTTGRFAALIGMRNPSWRTSRAT